MLRYFFCLFLADTYILSDKEMYTESGAVSSLQIPRSIKVVGRITKLTAKQNTRHVLRDNVV